MLARDHARRGLRDEIAGFLIALRTKGETVDELAGLARTMRALADAGASRPRRPARHRRHRRRAPDLQRVHHRRADRRRRGLRAWPSTATARPPGLSGSADVLEALGARIDLDPDAVARCIDEVGFGFMFAPAHHQATRFVVPVRKELAVRTIFNFLGPLTNPAGATRQLIGVSDPAFLDDDRRGAGELGVDRALVVSSEDGLDEMSIVGGRRRSSRSTATGITTLRRSRPRDVGLARARAATPSPAARPSDNADDRAGDPRRRAGPRARPGGHQRRRGDLCRRAARTTLEAGVARGRATRSTPAPPQRRSSRFVAPDPGAARPQRA